MEAQRTCWACGRAIDAQDLYCRHCGEGQGDCIAWYYRPWGIAVLTAFAMGPFSLLLVWRSPRLSQRGRWVATALILAFTAYIAFSFMQTLSILRQVMLGGL